MTIQSIFFTCLVVAALGIMVSFINFLTAPRSFKTGNFKGIFVIHILAGLCYVLGGLGALISGIAWIVTYLKH